MRSQCVDCFGGQKQKFNAENAKIAERCRAKDCKLLYFLGVLGELGDGRLLPSIRVRPFY
jgi:hypothetical protein